MLPVQNEHVDGLDDIPPETFMELSVHQIIDARNSVFDDMRKELKIFDNQFVQEVLSW